MSIFDPKKKAYFESSRGISVFSFPKSFESPIEELNFAKSYNQRQNPYQNKSNYEPEKPSSPILDDTIENRAIKIICKNNLQRTESPNYRHSDPIIQNNINMFEKPRVKVNIHSPTEEIKWKSSSKQVDIKPSKTEFELKKRELKTVNLPNNYRRNPIVADPNAKQRDPRQIEAKISDSYKKYIDQHTLLPAERRFKPDTNIQMKNRGHAFNDLMHYDAQIQGKDQFLTNKITNYSIEQRAFHYSDLNPKDHRKKGNSYTDCEERMKSILRK